MAFKNAGQWQRPVEFKADLKAGAVFFEPSALAFLLSRPEDLSHEGLQSGNPVHNHGLHLEYIGANPQCLPEGEIEVLSTRNYFLGNDPQNWVSGVKGFQKILYRDLYPGIDVIWEASEGHLKYTLEAQADADLSQFKWSYKGADSIKLSPSGLVQIYTSTRVITEQKPIAWQIIRGKKIPVEVNYQLEGDDIRFLIGKHQTGIGLVIDPTLIFSSYTGSVADNFGFTATYDLSGNLYAGGRVYSAGYPVFGAFQSSFQGMYDVGISKFNAQGTQLIYSTYLGGNNIEQPHSLVVNSKDELLVLGTTESTNFPTVQALQSTLGGKYDLFICRFNSSGNQLLAATYLGGSLEDGYNNFGLNYNYGDEYRGEIFCDSMDVIYIGSNSTSPDFPVTAGCFQGALQGSQDGIVGVFNPDLFSARWISYIGGSNIDAVYGVKTRKNGQVLITGGSNSPDFPVTAGTHTPVAPGGIDGFVCIIPSTGNSIQNATFIGTAGSDQSYFIQTDDFDRIYLYGQTTGIMPIVSSQTGGVYFNTGGKQFILCLDTLLTSLQFSTVFGAGRTGPDISPTAFLVDRCGNIYCSGWACSFQGIGNASNAFLNSSGLAITANAIKATTDGTDFYLMVLKKDASSLLYGTFLGGNLSKEHVDGGTSRFSPQGIVYHAVCAGCGGNSDFPTTTGVVSNTNNSTNCNLAAFKLDFEPEAKADFTWNTASLCPPYQVNFTYQGLGADRYHWDFGMGLGDTSNLVNPTYTFPASGSFDVELVAMEFTCMGMDTILKTIQLAPIKFAAWDQDYNLCSPVLTLTYTGPNADSLVWIPDTGEVKFENPSVTLSFPGAGQYGVTLIAWRGGCSDTIRDTFSFANLPPADFSWQVDTCTRRVHFKSGVSDSLLLAWDFGDGTISEQQNPTHDYPAIDQYTVTLRVSTDSCAATLKKDLDLAFPVNQFLFQPNVFTPNGDGFHDFFQIELKNPEVYELSIWDRWGNLVFQSTDAQNQWDGRNAGKPTTDGVYFYVIKTINCLGQKESRQGSVTVLH